jgi:hypothetical protein
MLSAEFMPPEHCGGRCYECGKRLTEDDWTSFEFNSPHGDIIVCLRCANAIVASVARS